MAGKRPRGATIVYSGFAGLVASSPQAATQIAPASKVTRPVAQIHTESKVPPPVALLQESLFWTVPWAHHFDFLTLAEPFHERELETALVRHLEKFLLELGQGFAFVGRQYRLDVGNEDFYIDLLFYHLRLRAFEAQPDRPDKRDRPDRPSPPSRFTPLALAHGPLGAEDR